MKEVVRYIHLNPVRAGIFPGLKELNRYPYCGHPALAGMPRKKRPWQDVDYVLGYFWRTTTLATVPIGYVDGLNRLLSSKGHMLVRGRSAPIVGRVCMDLTMLDVGEMPELALQEEVVIFGSQGAASITADEIASTLNTINYAIVSTLTERVPRCYLG